jgi:hypothetical protein
VWQLSPQWTSQKLLLLLLLLLLFTWTANGILPGGSGTTLRRNTQIHISHTTFKQSTQSYTNNKGHITHSDNVGSLASHNPIGLHGLLRG